MALQPLQDSAMGAGEPLRLHQLHHELCRDCTCTPSHMSGRLQMHQNGRWQAGHGPLVKAGRAATCVRGRRGGGGWVGTAWPSSAVLTQRTGVAEGAMEWTLASKAWVPVKDGPPITLRGRRTASPSSAAPPALSGLHDHPMAHAWLPVIAIKKGGFWQAEHGPFLKNIIRLQLWRAKIR